VKFRCGRKDPSWTELATFPGLSERADCRLVLSNGYGTADTAKVRDRTGFIGAETFDVLTPEACELLAQWQWPGSPLARG